MTLVYWK